MITANKNSWLRYLLITASLAIWGMVAWKFWAKEQLDSIHPASTVASQQPAPAASAAIDDGFLAGQGNLHNPFVAPGYRKPAPTTSPPRIKKLPAPKVDPPDVRITGLLTDAAGKIAIIEDRTGMAHLAAAGDSLFNFTVIRIEKSRVTVRIKDQLFQLTVNQEIADNVRH